MKTIRNLLKQKVLISSIGLTFDSRIITYMFLGALFKNLVACTEETKWETDVIYADLANQTKVSVHEIFEEIHIVPLHTDAQNLIAQISQVEYFENHFYVYDQVLQTLFCFDEKGGLVVKISRQGRGPGEYFYATNFAIDPFNRQILFLSPSAAQITIFNLEGEFVSNKTIKEVLGYNYMAVINDSVLLLSSNSEYQALFYCRATQEIFKKEFEFPKPDLHHLSPGPGSFYQFDKGVFVLPALEQTVKDVTEIDAVDHLKLSFGEYNNSSRQWEHFFEESERLPPYEVLRMHHIVGKDKFLHSHILKIAEVDRFVVALVVCEDTVKHLIYDKYNKNIKVFSAFTEDIVINPMFKIADNSLIAFETRNYKKERAQDFYQNLFSYYDADYLSSELLSGKCKNVLESHDPMTDNPFLVVYKFKE